MFMAAFYAPLLPLGLLFTAICLYLNYLVDKKTIIKSRVPHDLRSKMSIEMIENLEHFLTIYVVKN